MITYNLIRARSGKRNILFEAMEALTTEEEVKAFYLCMIKHYERQGMTENDLRVNIGYIRGYYNQNIARLWNKALNINHPLFRIPGDS